MNTITVPGIIYSLLLAFGAWAIDYFGVSGAGSAFAWAPILLAAIPIALKLFTVATTRGSTLASRGAAVGTAPSKWHRILWGQAEGDAMTCGLYTISCGKTGKYYVGSSHDINYRWGMHRAMLGNNVHHCQYLQNVWNKYGANNFSWDVIEECDRDNLLEREQIHLDENWGKLYNTSKLATGGDGNGFRNMTPEQRHERAKKSHETRCQNDIPFNSQKYTTPEQRHESHKKSATTALANGTHPSQTRTPEQRSEDTKKSWIKRLANRLSGAQEENE